MICTCIKNDCTDSRGVANLICYGCRPCYGLQCLHAKRKVQLNYHNMH